MRCFTVTKADPYRFRVLWLIERYGWDPTFICDSKEQKSSLISMGVPKGCIKVSGIPKDAGIQGVSLAREFCCQQVMPKNRWSLWIDDNVSSITGLRPPLSTDNLDLSKKKIDWRKEFSMEVTPEHMDWHLGETMDLANSVGTIFCGFSVENNFFFRSRKWQNYGYCRTQFALYKNDGSTWMPFETMMLEDLYKSIDVVCRYGQVLVNRHLKPTKPLFEQGGIGSFERRLPWWQDNCKRLLAMYPGLLKYGSSGAQYGSSATDFHLVFAKRSHNTIDRWRRSHGYLDPNSGSR